MVKKELNRYTKLRIYWLIYGMFTTLPIVKSCDEQLKEDNKVSQLIEVFQVT